VAQKILVEQYVEEAQAFLSVLDKNARLISSLFWYYSDSHERWRLVVAGELIDTIMTKQDTEYWDAYAMLAEDIRKQQFDRLELSDISVERTHHKLVRAVAERYTVTATQKPIWLDGFAYNSSYVDGMVILRSINLLEEHNG
jgi:hypothetical protein